MTSVVKAYQEWSDRSGSARGNWRAEIKRVLEGDPLAFEERRMSPTAAQRTRAEQLNSVARDTPMMMLACSFTALMLALVMWDTRDGALVWAWAGVVFAVSLLISLKGVEANGQAARAASRRGIRLATFCALVQGSLNGTMLATFFAAAPPAQQVVIMCLGIGFLCGGVLTLSPIPIAMIAYVAPIAAGSAYVIVASGEPIYTVVAGVMGVYASVLFAAGLSRAASLARRCAAEVAAEESAFRDDLTKLPNRAAFREELGRSLARLKRLGEHFALLCIDLDCFKSINDTMGHGAGDIVLIEAARRLKAVNRDIDVVARLGGDEFAVIAAGVGSKPQASAVANRIAAAFEAPFDIEGQSVRVGLSAGVALAPSDGDEIDALLRNADSALYATKYSGRGGHTFFRDRFGFVAEQATLEAELARALKNGELMLMFQPFVGLSNLQTKGFEALLRWRHPTRGLLSAAEIVPLFERAGLIDAVGEWVLREAIMQAASWPGPLRVAVNVSALQLRKPGFERAVKNALAAAALDPARLELELTESAMIVDAERAIASLNSLRRLGVTIALDDLGTGYSSLANLVELPLDRVKIDRSFVSCVDSNPMRASVVKISIELARALQLQVTAEGVEDEGQLAFLRSLGCAEAQGYLFSRPRPPEEIPALFERSPAGPVSAAPAG